MQPIRKKMFLQKHLLIRILIYAVMALASFEARAQTGPNGNTPDVPENQVVLAMDAANYGSADLALFYLLTHRWFPNPAKDPGYRGAAGTDRFRLEKGDSAELWLVPVEAFDPDDGTVSLGWNIWSDDGGILIDGIPTSNSSPLSGSSGNLHMQQYIVTAPDLKIVSPENHADYDVSEENSTATPPISFQARVIPKNLDWEGEIHWNLNLEYDTTISRGPWTSQKIFQTNNNETHYEQYSSEGGKVTVVATAEISGNITCEKSIEMTITGVPIPANIITARLKSLYTGATQNLLTGIAAVESGVDCYCQFYTIEKYGITDLWPRESYDGGSHIGLMQVPVTMEDAWNWLTNTQTAVDNHFNPALGRSHTKVSEIQDLYPNLPDLTEVQHENNALSIYRMGWSYPQHFYYIPNSDKTAWIINPDNPTGVEYADDVRANMR